ncbi:MAG: Crp/Fnr family transcriptional regulator [Leptolyngbyaceae cyanobacterium SL_7_1]|nr:Crp/Fnr family transcriptional regulator [Leptolyngbyaceae cyanobacterium SL_7_1]
MLITKAALPQLSIAPTIQKFSSHTTLPCRSGSVWKIHHGFVKTVSYLEDGTAIVLGIWGAGDVVGQSLSAIRPYHIESLTSVEASSEAATLHEKSTELLLTHLRRSEELMIIRSYKRIDIMLLKLLNWLAHRFGQTTQKGCLIDLRLTHQDLSELLGTTRVTVTRVLSQLEQQGLIQRLTLQRILLQETELWHYEI